MLIKLISQHLERTSMKSLSSVLSFSFRYIEKKISFLIFNAQSSNATLLDSYPSPLLNSLTEISDSSRSTSDVVLDSIQSSWYKLRLNVYSKSPIKCSFQFQQYFYIFQLICCTFDSNLKSKIEHLKIKYFLMFRFYASFSLINRMGNEEKNEMKKLNIVDMSYSSQWNYSICMIHNTIWKLNRTWNMVDEHWNENTWKISTTSIKCFFHLTKLCLFFHILPHISENASILCADFTTSYQVHTEYSTVLGSIQRENT